jgi:hypothetical protein
MSNGAGVSALDPVASAIYGAVGSAATGSPTGLMAAGIPLLRQPIRSMYLSKMMQTQPQYISNMLRLSNQAAPALPYAGMYGGGLLGANAN